MRNYRVDRLGGPLTIGEYCLLSSLASAYLLLTEGRYIPTGRARRWWGDGGEMVGGRSWESIVIQIHPLGGTAPFQWRT